MIPIVVSLLVVAAIGAFLLERSHRRTRPMAGGVHEDVTLPHTQEWELYHNGFSLCSKKLRVCLAELGISYASHPIDLIETGSYENVSRRFLAVNPAGLVPVLVHDGHPIYESHEEIVYAAEQAGDRGRALLPANGETRLVVEHWTEVASLVGDDPTKDTNKYAGNCIPGLTLPIFAAMCRHVSWLRFVEGFLFHPQRQRPLILAMLKLRGLGRVTSLAPAMAVLARSRRDMGVHLDALGEQLERSGGPWIAGTAFTLADVSWVVLLDRIWEGGFDEYFWGAGRRPVVAEYFERLRKRPSFETAIVAERGELQRRGIEEVRAAWRDDAAFAAALEG